MIALSYRQGMCLVFLEKSMIALSHRNGLLLAAQATVATAAGTANVQEDSFYSWPDKAVGSPFKVCE